MAARGQMLRSVLERLEKSGDLAVCRKAVSPRFELGAVLTHFNNEKPILFTDVTGYSMPVAGAVYGNRRIMCDLLDTTVDARIAKMAAAIGRPAAPRLLSDGPVRENVVTGNIDILRMLPVPTSNELDSAPFITAGMLAYKDIETGRVHMAVRRFQVNKGNSINALISGASPHMQRMLDVCAKEGRSLECAVILGYDAPFLLASQLSSAKYGLDKYAVDSALRGEPLELAPCHSIDFAVPADAEIVLEGVIRPGHRGPEGPFAELMGYYSEVGQAPLMNITAVMHRDNPVFQHAFPCREEHLAYGMIKEVEVYTALSSVVDVRDVNLTLGGGCRLHAVVSIRKRAEGDAKSAILTTLGAYKDIKHVVVVDHDVDIYDMMDVEFALASRFQASRDLVVAPGALGSPLEASHLERGVTDKVGFDATMPLGGADGEYKRAVIPGFDRNFDIRRYFDPDEGR